MQLSLILRLPDITSNILGVLSEHNARYTTLPRRGNELFKIQTDKGILSVILNSTTFDPDSCSLLFSAPRGATHFLGGCFTEEEVAEFTRRAI